MGECWFPQKPTKLFKGNNKDARQKCSWQIYEWYMNDLYHFIKPRKFEAKQKLIWYHTILFASRKHATLVTSLLWWPLSHFFKSENLKSSNLCRCLLDLGAGAVHLEKCFHQGLVCLKTGGPPTQIWQNAWYPGSITGIPIFQYIPMIWWGSIILEGNVQEPK